MGIINGNFKRPSLKDKFLARDEKKAREALAKSKAKKKVEKKITKKTTKKHG